MSLFQSIYEVKVPFEDLDPMNIVWHGNYMRYNNPHKASLYLSTGQPVIIWKKAALAEFVIKNKVGIAVDSLENLDEILDKITAEQYQLMKNNTIKLASSLRSGQFIKQAVKNIENY